MAEMFSDADYEEFRLAEFLPGEPVEQVDEIDLAEEVVLEPEEHPVMFAEAFKVLILFGEKREGCIERKVAVFRGEPRAECSPFLLRQTGRSRSLTERIGPPDEFAGEARFFQFRKDIVAGPDVKHAIPLLHKIWE